MKYEGDIYRPPSEAGSLIIQVTIGCAHNKCTFCHSFKEKKFRVRTMKEIFADLEEMGRMYRNYSLRIFLADGDALVLSSEKLLQIFDKIHKEFPYVERITVYGTAKDVIRKTEEELIALRDAGMEMVYMGGESGDPEVLRRVKKGSTVEEMVEAAQKLKRCGIKLSLTLISGLGGRERLKEHALLTAQMITKMKPEYVGFLTLMLAEPAPIIEEFKNGTMELLTPDEVLTEMRIFLENVDSEGTVFRTNHASNYVALRGNLNRDIKKMLRQLDEAEKRQAYRAEKNRRL